MRGFQKIAHTFNLYLFNNPLYRAVKSRNYGNHPILFGAVVLSSLVVLFMLVGTGCKCRANTRKKVIVHVKTDFRGEPDTVLALEA